VPIIVKTLASLDNATDGFDPEARYQMIPFRETREMAAQTGDFKAEMSFTRPDISSMSNFRILRQQKPNLSALPGPGVFVNRIALPEQSIVQFTLSGRAVGTAVLEGRDRAGQAAGLLRPDFTLEISVKRREQRRFAVCYVFDQVNKDSGKRVGFGTMFEDISRSIYERQANTATINIDGHASSSSAARTVTVIGTSGRTFNILDKRLLGRVISQFERQFPGVFGNVDAVVFPVPVPLQVLAVRPLGIQLRIHRASDGKLFPTVFLGPTQNNNFNALRHTLAHEIGHSFGLDHNPAKQPPGPRPRVLPDPDILPVSTHNLMFPTNLVQAARLNRNQIENIHAFIPPFRNINI
jgi:Metallo-peptidase family M12B Reprolysin-like